MKKTPRRLLSLFVASVLAWGAIFPTAATVAEAAGSLNLTWQTMIGEGTTLYKYTKSFGDGQAVLYVTQVDLHNQYVEVKPVYGTNGLLTNKQTVTQMARETGAIAAVNADFYDMSKRGAPFGIVMKDKQLVSSMGHISYWYSLGITSDKTAAIEHFGFAGKVTAASGATFPLRGVNKEKYNPSDGLKSHLDQLNLYTPAFGKTSLGVVEGYKNVVEVVVVDNVAKEVRKDQPGAPIPPNGYVLWGQGAAATFLLQQVPVGSTVSVEYQTTPTDKDWMEAVGGNVLLVDKGQALTSFRAESYVQGINSHTAVGVSKDGKMLYMVTVDKGPDSRGLSLAELAQVMVELGAYRAVNFDGGGSTTLAARMLGDTEAKLINHPKEGSERRVPTGLAVYNTAPPGTLAGFQIVGPSELLIGQTGEYTTKAYDNHYLPYKIQPSDITWTVGDSQAGSFDQHRFTAKKPGTATLIAKVGNITQSQQINVIGGTQVDQVIVEPAPVNVAPGQTLALNVKVRTKKGQVIQATPLSVKASVDSPLVKVDNNLRLTAGGAEGRANLTVSYDGVSTTVPVNIGALEQPWLTFDNLTGMYHTAFPDSLKNDGSFAAVTSGSGEPVFRTRKAAKLTYNFAGAPGDDVRIAYGRLGANPVTIPGRPFGMGVWVYGDGSKHWLRAEVIDAKGDLYYVDLANEIDWTGWKQVKGFFPATVRYPLQLRSIYVVNKPENTETRPVQGTLYFDEISLLQPYTAGSKPTGRDVVPSVPGRLSLGSELDLGYSFAANAAYLDKARIDVQSIVPRQLPGYVPADYAFTIKPVALKKGKTDQFTLTPATLTLIPKQWIKGKGMGLLYVNEANHTLDPLIGQMDEHRNWVYQVNAYGTYIPYYLDIPKDVPFMDIVNHPARAEITSMAARGYVKGLEPDLFGPEVPLTRAQFVTLLARVFQWKLPDKPKLNFKDAVPAYAQGAVQVAVAKGYVKGYTDKTFRPDKQVTRAEVAAILDRILQQKKPAKALADQKSWPGWAASSISNMLGLGIIDPLGDKFEPNKPTTRAVCVVALYRILQRK